MELVTQQWLTKADPPSTTYDDAAVPVRLVRHELPSPSADERRRAVRHPSQLTATFHRVDDRDSECVAQVLDVSARGARLRTARRVTSGEHIVVQINVEHYLLSKPTVAKVAYAFSHQGQWVLGCIFIEPTAHLEQLSQSHLAFPSSGGRRRFSRYLCSFAGSCRAMIAAGSHEWGASVVNVSQGGVRLAHARRMEVGSVLRIEVGMQESFNGKTVLAKVTNLQSTPAGSFELGCTFGKEMAAYELKDLLSINGALPPSSDHVDEEI